MRVLGQKSKNDLDLLYSQILYLLRQLYILIFRPKSSNLSLRSYVSGSERRGMGSAFHQLCPRYSRTLTPAAPTAIRLWETFTLFICISIFPYLTLAYKRPRSIKNQNLKNYVSARVPDADIKFQSHCSNGFGTKKK